MISLGIINYGSGNLGSILNVFGNLGIFADIVDDPLKVSEYDVVVLPGVGAGGLAIQRLRSSGLASALTDRYQSDLPIVGICLGAQLFFSYLSEGDCEGLGFLNGEVLKFSDYPYFNNGWCKIDFQQLKNINLSRSLSRGNTYFFNHRYIMPAGSYCTVSLNNYPHVPSIITYRSLCGIQFHPEKSQASGRIILRNVLKDFYGL